MIDSVSENISSRARDSQLFFEVNNEYSKYLDGIQNLPESGTSGPVKKVLVSGFPIEITDTETLSNLKKEAIVEAQKRKALTDALTSNGITPIAVLQKSVFEKITDKAGFYTFRRITPEGKVYGNGENLIVSPLTKKGIVIGLLSGVIFWPLIGNLFIDDSGAFLGLIFALVSFTAFFVGIEKHKFAEICFGIYSPIFWTWVFIADYFLQKKVCREIKQRLWPNRNDDKQENEDLFELILPTPPKEFKIILEKCYRADIKTFLVVDPRAFGVVYDKEKQMALIRKYDPIICFEEDDMIAVLAQFGEFPEEKTVIEYIQNEFDIARKNKIEFQKN